MADDRRSMGNIIAIVSAAIASGAITIAASSLPSQTGNSGKFLTTDGTDASWGVDGSDLTSLNATQLTSGTIPDARFPAVLPAVSGANLTNLPSGSGGLIAPSTSFEGLEDFLATPTTTASGILSVNSFASGSGAGVSAANPPPTTDEPGAWSISTGTTTGGLARASGASVTGPYTFGSGEVILEFRLYSPAALSDGTDTYTIVAGFSDAAGDGTDGAYVRYTHSANSGKWTCVTRSNTTESTADSGVTVATSTWYRVRIVINAAGTAAAFYINDNTTAKATIETNIPTGVGRETYHSFNIVKSAGTTARVMYMGYAYLKFTPTGGR